MAIYHIHSISPGQADGEVKDIYQQLKKEMGDVVEPISMHAIIPKLLESTWNTLREILVVDDKVMRRYKEAVASAVSSLNDCPYCVDAHTIMMIGLKDKQTARAIAKQDIDLVVDYRSKKLLKWSYNTKYFQSEEVLNPPFNKNEAPEIIGTAIFFHYLNRLVTVFLGETILPFNIGFLKGLLKQIAALMFSKVLNEKKEGNYQLEEVDLTKFGDPYFWARPNKRISSVLSEFFKTAYLIGKKAIPEPVYHFMKEQIADWNGSEYVNMEELKIKTGILEKKYELMATTLYCVAFAPYRVSEDRIHDLKIVYSLRDEQILAMFSWAAYMTATKIGTKLGACFK